MRLIDADALIDKLKRNSIFEKITDSRGMNTIEIIEEQPTAYYVGNEYNKAIDDFAEKIADWCDFCNGGMRKECVKGDKCKIYEMAEQLKG